MSDPRLTKRSPKQIAGISLVWVLTVLVALMMFGPGLNKLTNGEGWGTRFANWGLPAALVPIVGIAEVGGALLFLVPKLAPFGGATIAVTMAGATLTHLFNGEINRVPLTLAVVLIASTIGWYRWKRQTSTVAARQKA